MIYRGILALGLAVAPLAGHAQDAVPAPATGMLLELNLAEDTPAGDCRMTFVAANRSATDLRQAAWQVGVFDAAGVVRSLLVLDFGALAAGKTKITLFDLPGRTCGDISRIVINDVAQCLPQTGDEQARICLDGLSTASRNDIQLGL